MQNSWGQGAAQTSSPSAQPPLIQSSSDVEFTAFNTTLLPAAAPVSCDRPTAKAPHPSEVLKCPRCDSLDTKFCYYNNYSLTQPRYFCKNCKRYWTAGGALRNVPVGGGLRKNKRSKLKLAEAARAAQQASAGAIAQPSVAGEAGFASQVLDNRTLAIPPACSALPSHVVDAPTTLFAHPSGQLPSMESQAADNLSLVSHCVTEHASELNGVHARAAILPPQTGNFFSKEEANAGANFYCDPNQTPPFFPSYAANMSMPFHSATVPGYFLNYNVSTSQTGKDAAQGVSSSYVGTIGGIGASVSGSSAGEIKQEKNAAHGPVNTYDWQSISEGLFNGTGSADSNYLYTPSSSWPDFSQFNDAGPG